jgi:hypothetical protein
MYLRVNLHLWVDRDPQLVRQGAGHHHAPLLHHAPELKKYFKETAFRDNRPYETTTTFTNMFDLRDFCVGFPSSE